MPTPKDARRTTLTVLLAIAALLAVGCGSAVTDETSTAGVEPRPAAANPQRAGAAESKADQFARLRDAVLRGAARDFAQGTGIGGPKYESCVRGLLRESLDRPTLARLVQVYRRPDGQQFAAQALNLLAAPLGARCGHRWYVPELVDASRGLSGGRLAGNAVARLGVTYGPYLGVRCWRADHPGCDRVGVDIVFRHAATRVIALIDGRRLRLDTPGLHDGIRYRDWVGTLSHAGMSRQGSPLYIRGNGRAAGVWAGYPPVYVPVEFRVTYADGRRGRALFPRVFLSPGWG